MFLSENNWHIINQIIFDIYSSDNHESMRRKFLENIELLIPYDKANFFLADNDNNEHFITEPISIGFNDDAYIDYHETFEKFDYNKWIFRTAQNDAFILSELMSDQELNCNIFAREWLFSKGIKHVLLLSVSYNRKFLASVSLFRMGNRPNFTYREKKILNLLKDHLSLYLYKESFQPEARPKLSTSSLERVAKQYCLTSRETELLRLLTGGETISEICENLHISESTVRKHCSSIYQKMGVSKRSELNKFFYNHSI